MQIKLNGAATQTGATTLAQLIEEQGFAAEVVATAVDGVFVPRDTRETVQLTDGARVEVLAPMQGG